MKVGDLVKVCNPSEEETAKLTGVVLSFSSPDSPQILWSDGSVYNEIGPALEVINESR